MKSTQGYPSPPKEVTSSVDSDSWSPSPDYQETQKNIEPDGGETKADEALTELQKQIELLKKQGEETHDRLLRKQAELQNMRKRFEREKQDIAIWARSEVLVELLPVADACERALGSLSSVRGSDALSDAFRAGVELIYRKVQESLARFRVKPVASVGQPFDPRWHEALQREETDLYPDSQIIEEFQKGYQLDDRLLRPAQVKVAVHPVPMVQPASEK